MKTKSKFKDKIRSLLSENPDIFKQYPELLEHINLPDDRGASSLLERQVEVLKQRLQQFHTNQAQLIELARENEQISDNFTAIICQLIGFDNLSAFTSEFPKLLRATFEIDEVTFKTNQATELRDDEAAAYTEAVRRLDGAGATCDNRWPSNIISLFFSEQIKSAALIPMQAKEKGEVLGILALGSANPERYNNDLGTAHLNRLGLMAGICLARLQPET